MAHDALPLGPRASGRRTILIAGSSSVLGAVPAFLVGGLAIFIREDLDFGTSELGLVIATFFLFSALTAAPGGRMTERIGARKAMLRAAAVSGSALLAIGTVVDSLFTLGMAMALAGSANGIAQPAGNLAIARGVATSRQGLAFGMKQSSIPGATLVAGAMVPALGLTVGWRWAFISLSFGALGVAALMPKDPYRTVLNKPRAYLREGDAPIVPLIVLAGAAFCGAAVGTSLAAFFVESAVAGDVGAGAAGLLLVFGSATGILSRLIIGWAADRREKGHLNVVMLLLSLGAVGFAGLAVRGSVPVLLVATGLSFAAGWGWPGLFNFAVVRLNPNAPAAATAITQTGVFVGGVIGPAAFGRIADVASFETAWLIGALVNVLSAVFVLAGRALLRRARRTTSGMSE